mmetsp:Transcript_30842/g.99477  ORF Transcript_30842/g.99477 Transcript_30842/m.99477 type:complete len:243 (+) Transcript_30842:201-929(+)|eukprot:CAMPEP_0118917518 /NCGR_PEP_ID=MMETSP1166-20130328/17373_1 /TAXON_ID=1104430 /ORGANISM="Chrysoreinhardia sp, Strain CCMP3193" /LENGTH=242 /DNA_ID=CAMNT_0006857699 /DNA_START=196 /DNA_END=924 /DNA_ORIENTATION=-
MKLTPLPPLVVAGCSGAGKGTLIGKLMEWEPAAFGFSVSHTTRDPRPGELDGTHYHFTSVEKMKAEIDAGLFLESACVHGNYYGTSKRAVEAVQRDGKVCVLDIDVQGVRQVKESSLCPKYLWIEAPNLQVLEERLRGRGTETEEKIQKRLANAKTETAFADEGHFDRRVVNDDLDRAFDALKALMEEWYPHLALHETTTTLEKQRQTNPCAAVSNLFTGLNPFSSSKKEKPNTDGGNTPVN